MRSGNQADVISLVELVNFIFSKQKSGAPWTDSPSAHFLGITPHEIAHGPIVRYFLLTINGLDLIQILNRR